MPDLEKSRLLAELFGVSLDELAGYDARSTESPGIPRKGRHIFGIVTVGDRGQIVIPAKARKIFDIRPGEQLMVLGDEAAGIAIMKTGRFLAAAGENKGPSC
ncbi:MAG: AbrB/MazE/SpoVT family DNA-binding domain-containing protein [Solobacterium sp.]|nr:AbrB/MazE/SpoVT family DNA-binding domain-containing protein [Solobacterium sp.]